MKSLWTVCAMATVVLAACTKTEPAEAVHAADGGAASSAPSGAGASVGAEKGDASVTTTKAAAAATYAGKYTLTAGTMYVPSEKDWASVKFKNDETKFLGDGELTLTVEPSGRVFGGTEAGPLGASILEGRQENGTVAARLRRKDPTDEGLTGTLLGNVAGDIFTGTLQLAEGNAAVVRIAKLDAKRK